MESVDSFLNITESARDEVWENEFLKSLPYAKGFVPDTKPIVGIDGWPYLIFKTDSGGDDTIANVFNWLSGRGIGLMINPKVNEPPDYVLNYGMIWNFRERGELLTRVTSAEVGEFSFKPGQQVWLASPGSSYLPQDVRKILKEFWLDQGVLNPRIRMISLDGKNYDFCFSVESLSNPPADEHQDILETVAWFFPNHYRLAIVSEKYFAGFENL